MCDLPARLYAVGTVLVRVSLSCVRCVFVFGYMIHSLQLGGYAYRTRRGEIVTPPLEWCPPKTFSYKWNGPRDGMLKVHHPDMLYNFRRTLSSNKGSLHPSISEATPIG